jgi:hypothetical protein
MARKQKTITIGVNDLVYFGVGLIGGMAINGPINNWTSEMDPNMKKMIPVGKTVAGGVVAYTKELSKEVRLIGLGVASIGAIESAKMLAPEYLSINGYGTDGDFYDEIAGSDYNYLPLNQGGGRMLQDHVEDEHLVTGQVSGADVY